MAYPPARPLDTEGTIARLELLIGKADRIIGLLGNLMKTIVTEYERVPYQRAVEYYDFDEQAAINVTTSPTPAHEFKERPVKFLWLYAQGAAIQVSLDNAVSGESMIVPAGSIIWTRKSCRRVYGQALTGIGTLYIWGFW